MPELDEQLRLLIQQYGIAEVRRRLSAIAHPPRRPRVQVNAVDYVVKMKPPNNGNGRLLTLARLFEEKRFLPSSADIRNLFEAYGAAPVKVNARQTAIPLVFKFLSSLSDERIDRIINDGSFGGPSELAPIAEAIRAKSIGMRHTANAVGSSNEKKIDLEVPPQSRKSNA